MTKREYWIDELKAIAILLVAFEHALMRTMVGLELTAPAYTTLDNVIKAFHIPLFFMLSGYVYALVERRRMEQRTPKEYVKKKAVELLLPYVVIGFFIWLGKFVFSKWVTAKVGINDLFTMFWDPIAFMWFIYILFFIQILVYFLDRMTGKNTWLVLGITVLMNLSRIFITTDIKLIDRVLWYPMYYYLGVVFFEQREKVNSKTALAVTALGAAALVLHLTAMDSTPDNILYVRLSNALISLAVMAWYYLLRKDLNRQTKLAWVGSMTLYIYVIHPVVLDGIRVILWKLNLHSVLLWMVILFFGSLACSILYTLLAQKWTVFDLPFRPLRITELFKRKTEGEKK